MDEDVDGEVDWDEYLAAMMARAGGRGGDGAQDNGDGDVIANNEDPYGYAQTQRRGGRGGQGG